MSMKGVNSGKSIIASCERHPARILSVIMDPPEMRDFSLSTMTHRFLKKAAVMGTFPVAAIEVRTCRRSVDEDVNYN
jgi:hypothetical protein